MHTVEIPAGPDGRPSSTALGRAVVADALRVADPAGAAAAERETDWRRHYIRHFRRLVEAGVADGYDIAEAGLASLHRRMAIEIAPGGHPLRTETVIGTGKAETELSLPYRGKRLRGDALLGRLDAWLDAGVLEPSAAAAVREVAGNPEWLDLSGWTVVALGAGAEMGPLAAVLGWGGRVAGIDLPRMSGRIRAVAAASAGTLVTPADGADLVTGLAAVAALIDDLPGRLALGNYVYAPGTAYVLLSAAADALAVRLRQQRPDTALAFLATPTDVFAVPPEAVAQSAERYVHRSRRVRVSQAVSGGRLLRRNYPDGGDPAISDCLIPPQGPNYALAKRLQRWRATVARRDGVVAFNVAPPTRTRSVTSNRLLKAAYAGAHLFDVEVFEPATGNTLMAILLVHQLRVPRPAAATASADEAVAAAHGGIWRTAYEPRTALSLAAVRGLMS